MMLGKEEREVRITKVENSNDWDYSGLIFTDLARLVVVRTVFTLGMYYSFPLSFITVINFRMRAIKDMASLEKSSFQQINICHHQDMLGTKYVTN